VTYSNGDPFDVDNLFASMDRFYGQGVRNGSRGWLDLIASKTKVDQYTATFSLKQPWSTFQYVFADEPGMVVNTKVVGADVAAFGVNPPPEAGIGPYVLERYVPNEEVVLKARADYWGGPVCVERIRFVFAGSSRQTYDAYKNGDLDIGFLRDDQVSNEARAAGETLLTDLQDGGVVLMFNQDTGKPLSNPLVREAVVLAVDEDVINERAYGGELRTSRSLIHPDSRYYSDAIEQAPDFEPERARQTLDQAKAGGYDGRIRLQTTNVAPGPDAGIAVEAMLEAAGFEVEQTQLPTTDGIARVVQGDYDIVIWGFSLGAAEAYTQILFNFKSDSTSNRMRLKNPEVDAAIDEMLAAGTQDGRVAAIAELNNVIVDQNLSLVFAPIEVGLVVKPDVKGVKQTGTVMYLFDDAYIEG
jgi:peptide/nickel transport system substrate-binding protein